MQAELNFNGKSSAFTSCRRQFSFIFRCSLCAFHATTQSLCELNKSPAAHTFTVQIVDNFLFLSFYSVQHKRSIRVLLLIQTVNGVAVYPHHSSFVRNFTKAMAYYEVILCAQLPKPWYSSSKYFASYFHKLNFGNFLLNAKTTKRMTFYFFSLLVSFSYIFASQTSIYIEVKIKMRSTNQIGFWIEIMIVLWSKINLFYSKNNDVKWTMI